MAEHGSTYRMALSFYRLAPFYSLSCFLYLGGVVGWGLGRDHGKFIVSGRLYRISCTRVEAPPAAPLNP